MTTLTTTLMTRRLGGALAALALGVTMAGRAQAAPITFEFTGEVTISDFATILVGSVVTGSYTFDSDLADQDPSDAQRAFYRPVDLVTTFADGSSVTTSTAEIVILNDAGSGSVDSYSVAIGAPTFSGSFDGLFPNGLRLHISDDTGAAFIDDSLPLTPPDLDSFLNEQDNDFEFIVGDHDRDLRIMFTLTSLTLAPDTLMAEKDSFLRRGAPNLNEGANPGLRLQASGDNRVVVGFDQAAIEDFLEGNTLTTASLALTIAEIADNWGRANDRTVDAHPLTVDFAEGNGQNAGVPAAEATRGSGAGVTWNCAVDAEIANQATDCDPRWNGGDFGPATTDPVLHVNGLSGEVSWDVTADVQAGATAWLLKKTDERQPGRVSYHSLQGADLALAPRLNLETGPQDK